MKKYFPIKIWQLQQNFPEDRKGGGTLHVTRAVPESGYTCPWLTKRLHTFSVTSLESYNESRPTFISTGTQLIKNIAGSRLVLLGCALGKWVVCTFVEGLQVVPNAKYRTLLLKPWFARVSDPSKLRISKDPKHPVGLQDVEWGLISRLPCR